MDGEFPKVDALLLDALEEAQPRTRAECPSRSEPCPFVACRYHLWTDFWPRGRVRETRVFGDLEHTCVLNEVEANPDGMTLEAVGALLGVSREYIRQVEENAVGKIRGRDDIERLLEFLDREEGA